MLLELPQGPTLKHGFFPGPRVQSLLLRVPLPKRDEDVVGGQLLFLLSLTSIFLHNILMLSWPNTKCPPLGLENGLQHDLLDGAHRWAILADRGVGQPNPVMIRIGSF